MNPKRPGTSQQNALRLVCGRPARCFHSEQGFTLLELLVTVAVIGILAALLLPALSRGKMAAQGAQCAGNLRQLLQGWTMYSDDNSGHLASNADGQDGMGVFTNWVAGTMSRARDATNTALLVDPQQSALARYVPTSAVYKCPGDHSKFVRSYSVITTAWGRWRLPTGTSRGIGGWRQPHWCRWARRNPVATPRRGTGT